MPAIGSRLTIDGQDWLQLKVFSRKADPTLVGAADAVSMQRSLAQFESVLKSRIEQDAVVFTLELPVEPALVPGSAVKIEQVLCNLGNNAIDATAENTVVRTLNVSLLLDADRIVLRMRDNGPGLNDDQLQHRFDPFFTTKPVGKGVGIGLAIAYGIVQEIGGKLARAQS